MKDSVTFCAGEKLYGIIEKAVCIWYNVAVKQFENLNLSEEADCMKKWTSFVYSLVCILVTLMACSQDLPEKNDIISLYQKNEEIFIQATADRDYSKLEHINGVQKVYISEEYIDIQCGGAGLGSGTHYYGIFYSADDNLCAVDVACPKNKLVEQDSGYSYREENGDNRYYVEPLGNHFYYYEAHF